MRTIKSFATRMRARLGREDGVALIVASGALMVMGVFAAAVAAGAISLSDSANDERSNKRAVAAAEAGLRAATYRLNQVNPSATTCLTTAGSTYASGDPACVNPTETLGNGNSFSYYVSPVLDSGAVTGQDNGDCTGESVTPDAGSFATVAQRCVTAVGVSNGLTRRLQARVVSYISFPEFEIPGMLGFDGINIGCPQGAGQPHLNGDLGTNGSIAICGSSPGSTCQNGQPTTQLVFHVGTGGTDPSNGAAGTCGTNTSTLDRPSEFVVPRMDLYFDPTAHDPGGNADETQDGDDTRYDTQNANTDDPTDPIGTGISGVFTYTAATRAFSMANNDIVTFKPGVYNFCSFETGNSPTINIDASANVDSSQNINSDGIHPYFPTDAADRRVIILIDSPYRPGSGCPAGSGGVSFGNAANLGQDADATADDFLFRLYGNPCSSAYWQANGPNSTDPEPDICTSPPPANQTSTGTSACCDFTFEQSGAPPTIEANINAPYSTVQGGNGINFTGAISAGTIDFGSSLEFTWDNPRTSRPGTANRKYHHVTTSQCQMSPSIGTVLGGDC